VLNRRFKNYEKTEEKVLYCILRVYIEIVARLRSYLTADPVDLGDAKTRDLQLIDCFQF
jgi:hypothetical protein